jgi:hypothetical protein
MFSSDAVQTFCCEGYRAVFTAVGHIVVLDGAQLMVVLFEQYVDYET